MASDWEGLSGCRSIHLLILARNSGEARKFMIGSRPVGRKVVEARSEADASGEIYRFVGQLRIGLFDPGITHRIEELGAPSPR
jgi:hypothetical protein